MKKGSTNRKKIESFLPDLEDDRLTFSSDSDADDTDEDSNKPDNNIVKDIEDSDSCPEEVSFEAGREANTLLRKRALEQIKLRDDGLRKKRAEIHKRNKLQKEEKLRKLEQRKLPDEVLDEINSLPSTNAQPASKPTKTIINSEEEEEEEEDLSDSNIPDTVTSNEYVCGKTKFQVKLLKEELGKPNEIPAEIASFRQQMLYRKSNRREASARSYFAKMAKRKKPF